MNCQVDLAYSPKKSNPNIQIRPRMLPSDPPNTCNKRFVDNFQKLWCMWGVLHACRSIQITDNQGMFRINLHTKAVQPTSPCKALHLGVQILLCIVSIWPRIFHASSIPQVRMNNLMGQTFSHNNRSGQHFPACKSFLYRLETILQWKTSQVQSNFYPMSVWKQWTPSTPLGTTSQGQLLWHLCVKRYSRPSRATTLGNTFAKWRLELGMMLPWKEPGMVEM